MTVVFAENFGYDVGGVFEYTTLSARYPGTRTHLTAEGCRITANGHYFQTNTSMFDLEVNSRFEVRLGMVKEALVFDGTGTFNVFGIELEVVDANTLTVLGQSLPDLSESATLHFIIEKTPLGNLQLMILADSQIVLNLFSLPVDWAPNTWIGRGSNIGSGEALQLLPSTLTYVVAAVDTELGTYISAPTFTKRNLTVSESGTWIYSGEGFVQDTDKTDPTVEDPHIAVAGDSTLEISVADVTPDSYVKLYTNVKTEKPTASLVVNGDTQPAGQELRVIPALRTTSVVTLESITELGSSNSLGLRYYGERSDVITYANLCTQLGVTQGTLSNLPSLDYWLHVNLDGQEMFVAKGPVRWSISWDYLYSLGLVYGVDGFGQNPTGTPTNQFRTVEIGGATYLVRLLKGADTDPTNCLTGPNYLNPAGTQNSEFSRIFYPLCVDDPGIPETVERLANFSVVDLGVTGNGGGTSCQEIRVDDPTRRVIRGNTTGPSYVFSTTSYSTTSSRGWRPVLVRLT